MNRLKTVLMLSLATGLLLGAGALLGTGWMIVASVAAVAMNLSAYFWSHKLVLRLQQARPLSEWEHPQIHADVAELAARAGLPKPAIYLIPDDSLNAFATGRSPEHGVVAFTEGILHRLPRRELRGVIAHELSHIGNRDILVASVAAALAGAVGILGTIFQWGALLGGGSSEEEGSSPWAGLLFAILAPIGASLIQMAISRSREFLADDGAARITGDPEGLALALERLSRMNDILDPGPTAQPATASLMVTSPFSGSGILSWFSTHPPVEARIARLRRLGPGSGFLAA